MATPWVHENENRPAPCKGKIGILPLQGAGFVMCLYTQGVAIGLEYIWLTANVEGVKFASLVFCFSLQYEPVRPLAEGVGGALSKSSQPFWLAYLCYYVVKKSSIPTGSLIVENLRKSSGFLAELCVTIFFSTFEINFSPTF
jgi:hypothetical protein